MYLRSFSFNAVVIISAYGERETIEAAMAAGASGYLIKPVSDEQVQPALAAALVLGRPGALSRRGPDRRGRQDHGPDRDPQWQS